MKKLLSVFCVAALMCAAVFSAPKAVRVPSDLSEEIPDSELVSITFKSSVVVVAIDGISNEDEDYAKKLTKNLNIESDVIAAAMEAPVLDSYFAKFNKDRTAILMPGTHVFAVKFNNGKSYTSIANSLRFTLEAGKSYKLVPKIEKNKVVFDLLDGKTGKSLTNPDNLNLHQKAILTYTTRVLDAVAEGKPVMLRNGSGIYWNYGPDMTVNVKEKYNEEHNGFIGFTTDKNLKKGTIYIKFNDDNTLTKEEFLNLKPEECDRVYEIDEIANTVMLSFNLKEIKPKGKGQLMSVY